MVNRVEQHRPNDGNDASSSNSNDRRATDAVSRNLLTGEGSTYDPPPLHLAENARHFIDNRESRHGTLTGPDHALNVDRVNSVSKEDSETLLSTIGKDPAGYTNEQRELLALWKSLHGPLKGDMINQKGHIQSKLRQDYFTAMGTLGGEISEGRESSRQYYIKELSSIFAKPLDEWTSGEKQVSEYWTSQGGTIDANHDVIHTQLDLMDLKAQGGSIEFADSVKYEERTTLEALRKRQLETLFSTARENNSSLRDSISGFVRRRFRNQRAE